jgi:hypothetical protein
MCEVEGRESQALSVAWQKVDATFEMRYQAIELDLALKGLKDTYVERAVVRFGVQEGGVLGAQATRKFACLSHCGAPNLVEPQQSTMRHFTDWVN